MGRPGLLLLAATSFVACSQNESLSGTGTGGHGGGGAGGGELICTLVGCNDQLYVSVFNADGSYLPGTQILEVTADGVMSSCTFPLPPDHPEAGGGYFLPSCPTGLMITAFPQQNCTQSGNGFVSSCTDVPNTIQEGITLAGTAAQVHLRQTVNGVVVFDQTFSPSYQVYQPNGPDCGPTCREAQATWGFTLPTP